MMMSSGKGAYEAFVSDARGKLCGYREQTPVVMVPELPCDCIVLEASPEQKEQADDD